MKSSVPADRDYNSFVYIMLQILFDWRYCRIIQPQTYTLHILILQIHGNKPL